MRRSKGNKMNSALRAGILATVTFPTFISGGCATTIPAKEFIAKYTSNISVPNPDSGELPCRVYLGRSGEYFYLKDVVPFSQGGGFLGTTTLWRCPAAELPANFPESHVPGETVFDGRAGAKHTYMIQYYSSGPLPRTRPFPGGQSPPAR